MLSGFASVWLAASLMGNDDDGEPVAKKISPITWMMYHVFPINVFGVPGINGPVKIPRQYGIQQLFEGLGALLALKAFNLADDQELTFDAITHLAANLVPVGRLTFPEELSAGGKATPADIINQLGVSLAPTPLQWAMELQTNRNIFGSNVRKEHQFLASIPAWKDQFVGTPLPYAEAAKIISDVTGYDIYPEQIQTFVRDGVPIVGWAFDDILRLGVSLLSRPDRTDVESLLASRLVPLPGMAYDSRYYYLREDKAIVERYIRPADKEYMLIRGMDNEAAKAAAMRRFYAKYPWYHAVKSLRKSLGSRMNAQRERVLKLRREGRYSEASREWKKYIEMQKLRLRQVKQIMKLN